MAVVRILLALLSMMQLAGTAPSAQPSELAVYLVTFGPGDAPWEKFGHNTIVIQGSAGGVAYNWGMFDFAEKNFVWHFIQGKLWYWMAGLDAQAVLSQYVADDRTIWVQELNLTAAQRQALWDFARRNELPENRSYKYDYFVDNCSTRVRDAIDGVIGNQIKRRATTMPSEHTLRSETNRLTSGAWWLYTALDYVLGRRTDRKMSAWDEMFIPMRMRERMSEIKVIDADSGSEIPLVKSERTLNVSKRPPLPDRAPNAIPWFLGVGVLLGAALSICGLAVIRGYRLATWILLAIAFIWLLVSTVGSWFVIYASTLTDHTWVGPNENLLQLGPLSLPMMVLLVLLLRRRRAGKVAVIVAGVMAAASLLGLMLKVLPAMYQVNWNMIALALPANAGLAWAVWKMERSLPRKGATA